MSAGCGGMSLSVLAGNEHNRLLALISSGLAVVANGGDVDHLL